ncbi:MAG TPA: class III extradiol ring-cleavage dioxygenase [Steroidobacteraceae bacterium]|nr:class III extradiol ring-cleavage dioxygenase [Steroidobacteraceae bacterium]
MKLPTLFISHGGGPWPWIDERRADFAGTLGFLQRLPASLPAKPRAILSVSGHWEEAEFTVATSPQPPMVYDYYGFPEHTYHIRYAAPGSPDLAQRVRALLESAGIRVAEDAERGFDHGTFVPLAVMYPNADVPIVSLSLRSNLDASEHLRMGAALQALRDEGVLIVGSGLSYHNLRALRMSASAGPVSETFEAWLTRAVEERDAEARNALLSRWSEAPAARQAHPREEHLIPLMVAAGAAGTSQGRLAFRDHVWGVSMASYRFDP